jgi:hypothetical protein
LKEVYLHDDAFRYVVVSVLNSSLFFWFFSTFSDVRNLNRRDINHFRCTLSRFENGLRDRLVKVANDLMKDFHKNSITLSNDYGKHGALMIQSFQPRVSKHIIDEVDKVLAKHSGFTEEELDFIINYDIKYRMGRELESEE